jgi:hypothetical protein
LQDPIIRPLRELDSETLETMIPDIPSWVKCPDYERVRTQYTTVSIIYPLLFQDFLINLWHSFLQADWMNKFIFDMWPFLDKVLITNVFSVLFPASSICVVYKFG